MFGRVMLCEVIGFVGGAAPPVDMILALANEIVDPVKVNVHSFGMVLFHSVVSTGGGFNIISDHRRYIEAIFGEDS
jgi:hypothetical protein